MTRRFSTWIALASLAWLVGCGGGGGGVSETPQVVAKVAIRQSGLLLTQSGAVKQLSATVTDAEGNELSVPTTWTSTRPAAITVDSTGKVTAASGNGASQIVAEAGGIKSAPLLGLVAQPVLGAILLTDSQIVGDPVETTPEAVASFDNTYQVSLTGVTAPAVGAILINTESKAVAGRVLQVDSTSTPIKVTLGLVSLRELFTELVIDETIELANAPLRINPEIAAAYDIKRTGNTGVGMEAGGKLTLATMGIGTKAELKGKVKAGIACPSGIPPCSFEREPPDDLPGNWGQIG